MKQSTKFGLKLAGVIGAATYAGTLLGGLAAYQVAMHRSSRAANVRGQKTLKLRIFGISSSLNSSG